jgi:membrane-associated phospholipid phosphatase
MRFITDFADQAVVLPVVLALGVSLLLQGWRRGAAAWVVVVFATFTVVFALKVLFIPCGPPELHTPSGHVAAAAVVSGGMAALLLRRRAVCLPLALLAALIIGMSRLALGAHTWPEVTIGALVGLVGALALVHAAGPPPATVHARRVIMVVVVAALVFHGLHLPAEAHIRGTAWRLAQMLNVCQSAEMRL